MATLVQQRLTRALIALEGKFPAGSARWRGREYVAHASSREMSEQVVLGGIAEKFRLALSFRRFTADGDDVWTHGKPQANDLLEFAEQKYRVLNVSEAQAGVLLRVNLGDGE